MPLSWLGVKHKAIEVQDQGDCICEEELDRSADNVIKCRRPGCEMQWYHLACVKLQQKPHNWTCEACKKSDGG
ncbi:hypothetical protein CPB84DRAFT_1678634 [Gymnopilus junonius]|uniref:Zinc finger PHD-type domain-containing protein n=1 Tax=Gymnopilus junonius TaxID=109634 RepID=A0A9P5TP72_GYMJU|nr:hypothetical protein CPB84DRAFT_1678634 [Gymnopilus junonius]